MQVQDVMTKNPACCAPEATLRDAARLMSDNDCGEIPVIDQDRRPVGVITDRDIACRAVAQGHGPDTPVREVMSNPVVTASPETELAQCCKTLDDNKIRRAPVVDQNGACCGVIAQADIARNATEHETAQFVRDVSQPTVDASRAS